MELKTVDSMEATLAHIAEVQKNLEEFGNKMYAVVEDMRKWTSGGIRPDAEKAIDPFVSELKKRGKLHDRSKLESPEKELFDKYTAQLGTIEYNSPEYKECLAGLKPALEHHYKVNTHHPEHYPDGVRGMSLFDFIEMYCDWKAAVKRNKNGDLATSIGINADRFNIPDRLVKALRLQMEEDAKPTELVSLNSLTGIALRYCNGEYVVLKGKMLMPEVDDTKIAPVWDNN